MAPGYRSPFDHAPSPKPKPIHNTDGMLPILAILLCVAIILCLALFAVCAAPRHGHREHLRRKDDASVPVREMARDQSSITKYLAARPSEDVRRATNIRDLFLHDERRVEDMRLPLLPADTYSSSPGEDVKTATRRDKNVYQDPINCNWHGTNTLNTSWGWMA